MLSQGVDVAHALPEFVRTTKGAIILVPEMDFASAQDLATLPLCSHFIFLIYFTEGLHLAQAVFFASSLILPFPFVSFSLFPSICLSLFIYFFITVQCVCLARLWSTKAFTLWYCLEIHCCRNICDFMAQRYQSWRDLDKPFRWYCTRHFDIFQKESMHITFCLKWNTYSLTTYVINATLGPFSLNTRQHTLKNLNQRSNKRTRYCSNL